jgi:hypothetical protein
MQRTNRTLALSALVVGVIYATPSEAQTRSLNPDSVAQTATTDSVTAQSPRRESRRAHRDVITRDEIAQSGASNLYEAVQRLRPAWLRGGAASNLSGGGPAYAVYQNNTPLGAIDALRQLSADYAEELRFLDGPTATNTLPGLSGRRVAGAIVVVTPGNQH